MMVKYPHVREQIIRTIRILSDADYQKRAWVDHDFPEGTVYDCFDYAVNVLFDDTSLADDPDSAVGVALISDEEVKAISAVVQAVDNILNELGTELSDEEYINHPSWKKVVEKATIAMRVIDKQSGS